MPPQMRRNTSIEVYGRIDTREGSHAHTLAIESSHGREKGRTPFASTGMGKRKNRNHCCKVLFKNDPRSSAPQSPSGTGAGLGSGIWNRVGRLNFTPD